jgi:transcriptional regulator with GAF, ATPase, and Fis domain
VYRSDRPRAVIGCHRTCDFILQDRTVSRFHCEIELRDGTAFVRDLESSNGTTVDRVTVLHATLHHGAVLGLGHAQLRFEIEPDQVQVPLSAEGSFGLLIGRSIPMRMLYAALERAAHSDATVLLEGETGCGKELAARALHSNSPRSEGPFVTVDCAAVPGSLLESELFGHERGSFTGAEARRVGAFEAAAKGTLFLDEIGELEPEVQPKLLRALERKEIRRVGANDYRPVDVRVIAATNRTLRAEVNTNRFRSDLYYRLAVIPVRLPPLRERMDDLPLLVGQLLEVLGADAAAAERIRSPGFIAELVRRRWSGNVRELRNHIERALVQFEAEPTPSAISRGTALDAEPIIPYALAKNDFQRRFLLHPMRVHGDNLSAAARAAHSERMNLYRLLRKHRLR